MKITVFGATGGVGTQLVEQGLQRGHAVIAVVRDAARLTVRDPALRIFTVAGLDDPAYLLRRSAEATPCCRRWGRADEKTGRSPPPVPAPC